MQRSVCYVLGVKIIRDGQFIHRGSDGHSLSCIGLHSSSVHGFGNQSAVARKCLRVPTVQSHRLETKSCLDLIESQRSLG